MPPPGKGNPLANFPKIQSSEKLKNELTPGRKPSTEKVEDPMSFHSQSDEEESSDHEPGPIIIRGQSSGMLDESDPEEEMDLHSDEEMEEHFEPDPEPDENPFPKLPLPPGLQMTRVPMKRKAEEMAGNEGGSGDRKCAKWQYGEAKGDYWSPVSSTDVAQGRQAKANARIITQALTVKQKKGDQPNPTIFNQFNSQYDYGFLKPAGLDTSNPDPNSKKASDKNCGRCPNCKRRACNECSHCKRGDRVNCIDKYCLNQRDGLAQRKSMKEMYMQQRTEENARKKESSSARQSYTTTIDKGPSKYMQKKYSQGERPRKQALTIRKIEEQAAEKFRVVPKPKFVTSPNKPSSVKTTPVKSRLESLGDPFDPDQNSIPQGDDSDSEEPRQEGSSSSPMKQMRSENKSSDNMVFIVEDGRNAEEEWKMDVKERVDKIMEQVRPGNKYTKKVTNMRDAEAEVTRIMGPPGQQGKSNPYGKPSGSYNRGYVYGASANAKKVRRCGECEGCMREDCGKCEICLDKPRFGGPGKLKKACPDRKCEIMAMKKRNEP